VAKKPVSIHQLPLLSSAALLGPTGLVQLQKLQREAEGCTACELHESRSRVVYGDGSATARIALVGEGPGAAEDREGLPFVGASGRLLNQLLARPPLIPHLS
jgi:uracil-DNA glycosylase